MRLSGAVVSTSDYEFAGPSLIPEEDRRCTAHPTVHPPKWLPWETWGKVICGKSDVTVALWPVWQEMKVHSYMQL